MAPRPDSIRAKGLKAHVDAGKDEQHGRGYRELKNYLEKGDELGQPMTISRLMIAFNKSRPTMTKWIQQYCEDRGVPYPNDLEDLLVTKHV